MRVTPRGVLARWWAVPALAALLAAGCGPQFGSVSGKVTYKDKALKGGNVTFSSTEGKVSGSEAISEDGSYTIPKLQTGTYKVCVETASLKPASGLGAGKKPYKPPSDKAADKGKGPATPYTPPTIEDKSKRYTQIPDKYMAPQTTDITCTVTGGSQEFDIKLK